MDTSMAASGQNLTQTSLIGTAGNSTQTSLIGMAGDMATFTNAQMKKGDKRKAAKCNAPKDNDSRKNSKSGKQILGLAKSFRTALTTNDLVSTVTGEFPSDSIGPDIKNRKLDKIDICLIPVIYLIRMTFTTFFFAISLLPTLSQIVKVPVNTLTWITVFGIHFALCVLELGHNIVQIRPIQFVLNMLLQTTLARICLFWPRFYYSLLYKKRGRSIWNIITNPVPPDGKKVGGPVKMVCLNENLYCHSFYQVRGAFAHLNQTGEPDLDEAIAEATQLVYYDDPLH